MTNETALPSPAPWSLVGASQLMPGYAYGFSYPTAIINLAIPPLIEGQRQALWDTFFGLFRDIPDLPPVSTEIAYDPAASDHLNTIRWFLRALDHLLALAQLPVAQSACCIGIAPPTATLVIPGLALSTAPIRQLAIQAANLFQNLSSSLATDAEMARIKQACHQEFAALKATMPRKTNTPRLITAAAQSGIAFQEMVGTQAILFGLGRKSNLFDSTFSQFTSALGARLAKVKYEAATMLRRNRLPVPAHRICRDETEALRAAESLGYPVVIKPADKDGGIAVRADLRTPEEVSEAFAIAEKVSKLILVEQYVTGKDYRLTVFGNTCVWAVERQPAGVTGDGTASIQQLIDIANVNPARAASPHAPLKPLKLDREALGLLARDDMTAASIPQVGQFVKLRRASNITSGGMPIAVTDIVHPDNARLAIRAARALHLDIAGIDLLIPDIAVSWKESGAAICEVNAQPQLGRLTGGHLYPLLLRTMLNGDGHIPVIAVLGGNLAERLSLDLANNVIGKGIQAGTHLRAGIALGNSILENGRVPELAAGQMLTMNRECDALIFGATNETLLRDGFPVPRIDMLVLTGEYLDRTDADTGVTDASLIRIALRMLAPAARTVLLLDQAAEPTHDVAQALNDLGIAHRVVSAQEVLSLAVQRCIEPAHPGTVTAA